MTTIPSTYVCIMAGGSGERFWPMSRKQKPKHLVPLLSDRTLLEETVRRVESVVPSHHILILTNELQRQACLDVLPGFSPDQVIAEPEKRDTAAACALGTALVHRLEPGAVVAFLAADALVHDSPTFAEQVQEAARYAAQSDAIVTLGIRPTFAATRFGYLHKGEKLPVELGRSRFFRVKQFVEKPNQETARLYLAQGNYLWNAGIFIWKTTTFLRETHRLQPTLAEFIENFPQHDFAAYLAEKFPTLLKKSVDYAVMERAGDVVMMESLFDWDDVGSWTALPAHLKQDSYGNTRLGQTVTHDSRNNIIVSQKRVVALCGVSDLVVVETADAILVCHRDAAEQIKHLQPLLPNEVR